MPFQSVTNFTFPFVGTEPFAFRGRSTAQSASAVPQFDVYNFVFLDILDNIGADVLSWAYYISWHVRTSVTSVQNQNLSTFRGSRQRRNLGVIQFGTNDGVADDDIIRYNNQYHKKYNFIAFSSGQRQSIAVSTSTVIPLRLTNAVYSPGTPFESNPNSFNFRDVNGTDDKLPFSDTVVFTPTNGVDIIYTVHYTGVYLALTNASIELDGYV